VPTLLRGPGTERAALERLRAAAERHEHDGSERRCRRCVRRLG
jgi:hypothetical protein